MNAPFAWPGGKNALKKTLLEILPAHTIYAEVFAGSAKLLFAKPPSEFEVINDLNGDLINFFRVAKHRPAELAELLEAECVHAGRFRELKKKPDGTAEIERAMRFAYLVWFSFGAKGEHFASLTARCAKARHPLDAVRELLQQTAARLARVLVEQRDFMDILERYDSESTFFYLDPPYVEFGANGRYLPLTAERRVQLFDALARLKGVFLMSLNDCPEIRSMAKQQRFQLLEVDVTYTLGGAHRRSKQPELLIANYPIKRSIAA